jgi:hypothetical protein
VIGRTHNMAADAVQSVARRVGRNDGRFYRGEADAAGRARRGRHHSSGCDWEDGGGAAMQYTGN